MVQVIRMPMMGNTMETGVLVEWTHSGGDQIDGGEIVAVVESEKASAEIVAEQDGVLARTDVEEGEEVPPGTVLGILTGADESLDDAPEPRSRTDPEESDPSEFGAAEPVGVGADTTEPNDKRTPASTHPDEAERSPKADDESVPAAPGARKLAAESDIDLATVEGTGPEGTVLRADIEAHIEAAETARAAGGRPGRVFASPTTRQLAREHGISLAELPGTGVGGRVTESDVRAAIGQERPVEPAEPSVDEAGSTRETRSDDATVAEEHDLTGVRKTVATRMATSARTAPHVTLDRDIDATRAVETAQELSTVGAEEIGFTDLLIAAVVRALAEHPEFNARFEDGTHQLISEINVAVAVDADIGLVTPVIREADRRTVEGISAERRRLTEAVLDGSHTMDDLQGGTFTISNLGMFGVDSFTPIINPPQVAILGVGRVSDGACTLSLSFDHRPVDGADAARFLGTITEGLEAPSGLVYRQNATVVDEEETGAAGEPATGPGGDGRQGGETSGEAVETAATGPDVDTALETDIGERASEIAEHHGWTRPDFDVEIDGERPTITVDRPADLPAATARRLTYAACRESEYAAAVPGLLDPELEIR